MLAADVRNVGLDHRIKVLGATVVVELLAAVIGGRRAAQEGDGIGPRDDGDRVDEDSGRRRFLVRVVRLELEAHVVLLPGFQASGRIDDGVTGSGRKRNARDFQTSTATADGATLARSSDVGARAVGIDVVGPLQDDPNVLPLAGQLRLVADDQIILHRLADGIQSELNGRVFDSADEARAGPAGVAVAVRLSNLELGPVRDATEFGFVDAVIQQSGEEALLRLGARPSGYVRPAFALARQNVAIVVVRASRVAFAGFASVAGLRQTPVFR